MEGVKYERGEYEPTEEDKNFVIPEGYPIPVIDDRPVTYEYMVESARKMAEDCEWQIAQGYPTTYAQWMECNARMTTAEIAQMQADMANRKPLRQQWRRQQP